MRRIEDGHCHRVQPYEGGSKLRWCSCSYSYFQILDVVGAVVVVAVVFGAAGAGAGAGAGAVVVGGVSWYSIGID